MKTERILAHATARRITDVELGAISAAGGTSTLTMLATLTGGAMDVSYDVSPD